MDPLLDTNTALPSPRPDAPPPAFLDAASCKQWLKDLPLTNIQAVQAELGQQLELLAAYPLAALERLKALELLRETVSFIAGELGKRYRNKPVPFASLELAAWNGEQALWQILDTNYRHCLRANIQGDADVAAFTALITQRIMACIVSQMLAYGHGYHPVPPALWHQLHRLYTFAEARDTATKRIKDTLNRADGSGSVDAMYAKALFLHLADPQQLSSRQLDQIDRWLDKWSARAPLGREQPPTPKLSLVAVDIDGDSGPELHTGQAMKEKRFLDTEHTAMSLRKRVKFLASGGNATEIGLGDDCIQPGCESLLRTLYQRWCELPPARAHQRIGAEGVAQLCFAFPAIHFFLNDNTPFKQPGETLDMAPEVMEDMRMYGHVTLRTQQILASRQGFPLEDWRILDRSAGGFRLERTAEGERISQNQLLVLRPEGGEHFILAVVRWLVANEEGGISIGARTLPGKPIPLAVQQMTLNPRDAGPFQPAFQLAATSGHEASLVLPIGWFQPNRRILAYSDRMETFKLTGLLEKGANFDRVSFKVDNM